MKRLFGSSENAEFVDDGAERISPDLPFELQSKMLDQLTTVSVAGAGLAITLIGSILKDAPPAVWISVILFGLAAVTAVGANIRLIGGLFSRKAVLKRSKLDVSITMTLIGAAAGFLSMDVYSVTKKGETKPTAAVEAKQNS